MSLSGQNEHVHAVACVPDRPRFCMRVQTNWSVRRRLSAHLIGRGFSQRGDERFYRQMQLGPMRALCSLTVYASFGREVVANVEVQMLSAYHRGSRDNSQEVCLAGDDNFLKDGDVREDNTRVARSVDNVITLARIYFRRLITSIRIPVYVESRLISHRDVQIVDNTETVTISGFEVAYDFRAASPVSTVRSLAPRIQALARSTGEHSLRHGEGQRSDGPRIWAQISRSRSVVLYCKTDIRVRAEDSRRRRNIQAFAVRHPRARGVPGGRLGYIEVFSQTFFIAAEEFAALANSILAPGTPVTVSNARTVNEFFSTLRGIVSNDRLRGQILARLIDSGRVHSRLHYRIIPRLASGPSPILQSVAPGVYTLRPEYDRAIQLVRETAGIARPSKRQRRAA